MSNKNYSFESRAADRKPILNKINCKPISNILPFNKIPKDHLKQKPLKILNGTLNKNNNNPLNFYSSNNLEIETRKTLRNSTSNAKIYNNLDEELKTTFFAIENNTKTAKAEKAYYDFPNFNDLSKNNKETIDVHDSNIYQNLRENKLIKNLPEDSNRTFIEKSMHFLNNVEKYNNSFAQKNSKEFLTKNLSMNSKNNKYSVNFLPIQSQNSSCLTNNILLTSTNKHSFNNSNITGAVNCRLNSKPANSTFLKGGFILSGIDKKKNNAELTNINITGIQNFLNPKGDLMIKKNNHNINNINLEEESEFNKNTINSPKDLNRNSSKIKKLNHSKKQNIKNIDYSNQIFSLVNKKKFDLLQNHRRNDSIYALTDIQKHNDRNLGKVGKNRNNSFNSLKIKSNSNATKIQRPKSLNLKQIINDYNIKTEFDSHYTSIENKRTMETSQSNFKNIFNEGKTFSVLDLKKKYNDVIKKKNIPTSMLIKSIKSNVNYKHINKTISHHLDMGLVPENNLHDFSTLRKSIINPIASINRFHNYKETFNRNENEVSGGIEIPNLKSIKTHEDFLYEMIEKSETNPQKKILLKNSNLIVAEKIDNNCVKKKSNSKDKIISNNISNLNEILLNYNLNKIYEKKKQIKNSEDKNKVNIKYGVNNDDKLTKNLYKPKRNNTNNVNKHFKKDSNYNIFLTKNFDTYNLNTENTLENRTLNKLEIHTTKEDINLKRLRVKNKSFGNMKLNWNNLIFTSKSKKLVNRNNIYKTNNRSNVDNTDSQLKSQLQHNLESAFLKLISKEDLQNHNSSEMNNLQKNKETLKVKNFPSINTNNLKNNNLTSKTDNNKIITTNSFKEKNNSKEIWSNSIKNNLLKSDLIESIINYVKDENEEIKISKNSFKDISKIVEYNTSKVKDDDKDKTIFNNNDKPKLDYNYFHKASIIETQNNFNQHERILKTEIDNNIFNQFTNFKIIDINSIKGNNEYIPNENSNIKILENLSYHNLNDISSYNIISNTDPNEIFITKNNYYQGEEIQSELSTPKISNKTNKNQKEKHNNNQLPYSELQKENNNDMNKINSILNDNLNDYFLESKESLEKLNKINKSFSVCSQFADDIDDMNTIIKRLTFIKNHKNEENIFKVDNKVYTDFEVKFKNEIENLLFLNVEKNFESKKIDLNDSSSLSTDTSSKKRLSPNHFKDNLKEDILTTGREKINLFETQLSKI